VIEWVRRQCLSFPHATESIQWGDNLVFKVGGKIFAVAALEPARYALSLKCAPDKFDEMIECPGIAPAPYLARAKWIALEHEDAIPPAELAVLLRKSYDLVYAKLPKKTLQALNCG
jgi:predicted DNA-binding protein (MmcQ/YjbR family)